MYAILTFMQYWDRTQKYRQPFQLVHKVCRFRNNRTVPVEVRGLRQCRRQLKQSERQNRWRGNARRRDATEKRPRMKRTKTWDEKKLLNAEHVFSLVLWVPSPWSQFPSQSPLTSPDGRKNVSILERLSCFTDGIKREFGSTSCFFFFERVYLRFVEPLLGLWMTVRPNTPQPCGVNLPLEPLSCSRIGNLNMFDSTLGCFRWKSCDSQ